MDLTEKNFLVMRGLAYLTNSKAAQEIEEKSNQRSSGARDTLSLFGSFTQLVIDELTALQTLDEAKVRISKVEKQLRGQLGSDKDLLAALDQGLTYVKKTVVSVFSILSSIL